ncbi:serine/threonine protein kinase [Myxococcota bacterium]|nr:serine/threonine protein kinase [Myxococcota bacterium]
MSTFRLDDAATFAFGPPSLPEGLPSDAPVDSTLHRRILSLPPEAAPLPALPLGPAESLTPGALLGQGGMGTVHAAHDAVLRRTVAVKRPLPQAGPRAAAALVLEARVLAGLDHPGIVPVHALGEGPDGAPVLVMKRVEGERWSNLLHAGPDLDRDLHITLQVCDALRFAHDRGLLHRDVKPDNVMVGRFGEVWLMDWGCACPLAGAVTTEVVGTPSCIAPEMLDRGAGLSPATDVFLVGATLHQALTGRARHAGAGLREVLEAAWVCPSQELGPGVDEELAAIVNRACARTPAERFADAQALARAIAAFQEHRAARELAARAAALLPELEAAIVQGRAEADALFAQVRFGFRAALESWPGCQEAAQGLSRALAWMLPHKLEHGELGAVEALLDDLPPAQRQEWAGRLSTARAARAHAEAERRSFDLAVAARERRDAALAILLLAGSMAAAVAWLRPARDLSSGDLVGLAVGALVAVGLSLVPFRRQVLATRASRAILLGLVGILAASLAQRLLGWSEAQPVHEILRADHLLFGLGLGLLSMTTERALLLTALPHLVAVGLVTAWPERAGAIFPVVALGALVVGVVALARRARTR